MFHLSLEDIYQVKNVDGLQLWSLFRGYASDGMQKGVLIALMNDL